AAARDATTMIRVPAPRTASPTAPTPSDSASVPVAPDHPSQCSPPLFGSGSGPAPISTQSRPGPAAPHPLPTLAEDGHATAVFSPPHSGEKTEVLAPPRSPAIERTECLPGGPKRSPVEPTLVLAESKPASPPTRPPPRVEATV